MVAAAGTGGSHSHHDPVAITTATKVATVSLEKDDVSELSKAGRAHLTRVAALAYYAFASMGAQYFVKVWVGNDFFCLERDGSREAAASCRDRPVSP